MHSNSIVVTGCDSTYAPLASDLIRSIREKPDLADLPIGVLDLGLDVDQVDLIRSFGVELRKVGWDLDFPGREEWENKLPGYKAMVSRSFLREHFPGYSTYLWMDADTWVQRSDSILKMIAATKEATLSIAAEFDRQYPLFINGPAIWQVYHNWYAEIFGADIANKMNLRPMLNCGVFALSANAPHWQAWRKIHEAGLSRNKKVSPATFMIEQLALNVATYLNQLNVTLLPAGYNWLCHHAMPVWNPDKNLFLEPSIPNYEISILHLSQKDKIGLHNIALLDQPDIQDKMTLRYPHSSST